MRAITGDIWRINTHEAYHRHHDDGGYIEDVRM